MREILEDPSPQCPVNEEALFAHFHPSEPERNREEPANLPPPSETQEPEGYDLLQEEITADEVFAKLKKTKNTAPGPDRIRYLHWKKFDPSCHILALQLLQEFGKNSRRMENIANGPHPQRGRTRSGTRQETNIANLHSCKTVQLAHSKKTDVLDNVGAKTGSRTERLYAFRRLYGT